MSRSFRMWSCFVLCLVVLLSTVSCALFTPSVEKKLNPVIDPGPYTVHDSVKQFHSTLFIADLHADSLLWGRNLLKQSNYGHVDIPRALEGNLGFQVFGVVTKTPKGQNFQTNTDETDRITSLTVLQSWPVKTWGSLLERALYQAEKLERYSKKSDGRLMIVTSVEDLDSLISMRSSGLPVIGGFCGLEGIHAIEGELANIDRLYDAGFRMIGLHHFFDNKAGGSAHGITKGGLTAFGRELVSKVQAKGMVIDLAHSSPKVIDDVLAMSTAPVVVSHTGVCGTCDSIRNLTDSQVRGIASAGGVVGIGLFGNVVCGDTVEDTARAMRYAADLAGVDCVGLGSDFDGAVKAPVDARGLPLLTKALLDQGFSEEEVAKIMGGNVVRVLRQVLK